MPSSWFNLFLSSCLSLGNLQGVTQCCSLYWFSAPNIRIISVLYVCMQMYPLRRKETQEVSQLYMFSIQYVSSDTAIYTKKIH